MKTKSWKKNRYLLYKKRYDITEPNDLQLLKTMVDLERQLRLYRKDLNEQTKKGQMAAPGTVRQVAYLTDQIYQLQAKLGISRKDRAKKEEQMSGSSIAELAVQLDDFIEKNPEILKQWEAEERILIEKMGGMLSERREFYEKELKEDFTSDILPNKEQKDND